MCATQSEFAECVALHNTMWKFSGNEGLNTRFLTIANATGGHVYGAYNKGSLVAFALAFAAAKEAKPHIHSNVVGVLPDYQGKRIGRLLKLYQREQALAVGLNRIEWTFDPLELKNAYFNISCLGTITQRFIPNFYGISTSPLHSGLPTDRLLVEWNLDSPRVHNALSRTEPPPVQVERCVTVPNHVREMRRSDRSALESLQTSVREQFQEAFASGLTVTGFSIDERAGTYMLSRED